MGRGGLKILGDIAAGKERESVQTKGNGEGVREGGRL